MYVCMQNHIWWLYMYVCMYADKHVGLLPVTYWSYMITWWLWSVIYTYIHIHIAGEVAACCSHFVVMWFFRVVASQTDNVQFEPKPRMEKKLLTDNVLNGLFPRKVSVSYVHTCAHRYTLVYARIYPSHLRLQNLSQFSQLRQQLSQRWGPPCQAWTSLWQAATVKIRVCVYCGLLYILKIISTYIMQVQTCICCSCA
jgi:hypothetical protein